MEFEQSRSLEPVSFTYLKWNQVKHKVSVKWAKAGMDDITIRYSLSHHSVFIQDSFSVLKILYGYWLPWHLKDNMAFSLWPHSRPPQPRSYVHCRLPVWATTWPDLSNGELSKTQSSKYTPDLVYAVELLFPVLLILLLGLSIGVAFHAIKRWRKKRV